MSDFLPKIGFVLFAGSVGLIFLRGFIRRNRLEKMRVEALTAFQSLVVESSDPRFRFRGTNAIIAKIEEPSNPYREPAAWFTLTIFARNEFCEYFMFKSVKPIPFIKHVPQSIAKHVLQDLYVPPSTDA